MSQDSLFAALNEALPILDQPHPPVICLVYSATEDVFSLLDTSDQHAIAEHFLAEDKAVITRLTVEEIGDVFASRFANQMAKTLIQYARTILTRNQIWSLTDVLPALSDVHQPKKVKE